MPGAQFNVNLAWAITWIVDVTIYCTFCNNNSPPPGQFLCKKILLIKLATVREMLIEQNFELRGPGPPSRICTPITSCFHDKTIISKENFRVDCYSLLTYCRRQCTLLRPTWTKSLRKFNPKMQDFNVVWTFANKRRTEQLYFFNWLSNVKNPVNFK